MHCLEFTVSTRVNITLFSDILCVRSDDPPLRMNRNVPVRLGVVFLLVGCLGCSDGRRLGGLPALLSMQKLIDFSR